MQENDDVDNVKMPLLVYVSREKKPSNPHHFKAGALNVLVRLIFITCFTNTSNLMLPHLIQ